MHYFIMKILFYSISLWELQQITFNYLWDIDFQDFMSLYKKFNAKPYSLLVIDATVASDNPLCFRKNIL